MRRGDVSSSCVFLEGLWEEGLVWADCTCHVGRQQADVGKVGCPDRSRQEERARDAVSVGVGSSNEWSLVIQAEGVGFLWTHVECERPVDM